MKIKNYLHLIIIFLISACSNKADIEVRSPSGHYKIITTVNNFDSSKSNYALVEIHLINENGKEVDVLESRASAGQKWAVGWLRDREIVILQSSDVGVMAFEIINSKLVKIKILTSEMESRASELYKIKYGL